MVAPRPLGAVQGWPAASCRTFWHIRLPQLVVTLPESLLGRYRCRCRHSSAPDAGTRCSVRVRSVQTDSLSGPLPVSLLSTPNLGHSETLAI